MFLAPDRNGSTIELFPFVPPLLCKTLLMLTDQISMGLYPQSHLLLCQAESLRYALRPQGLSPACFSFSMKLLFYRDHVASTLAALHTLVLFLRFDTGSEKTFVEPRYSE